MKVVRIPAPNLKYVPDSLRRLADMMESGLEPKAAHAIVVAVDEEGVINVYGYGACGPLAHEIGVLHMAAAKMIHYSPE
jgi:hypothetical protein